MDPPWVLVVPFKAKLRLKLVSKFRLLLTVVDRGTLHTTLRVPCSDRVVTLKLFTLEKRTVLRWVWVVTSRVIRLLILGMVGKLFSRLVPIIGRAKAAPSIRCPGRPGVL